MEAHQRKALETESTYLAGAENNLAQARGRQFRGSIWQTTRLDEGLAVREELAKRGLFDRDLLARLPQNRRVVMRGYERRWWWFGKRQTGVAIASVLAPPGNYVAQESAEAPPPPVGLSDLLEHVRRIAAAPDVPHVIGVCSPSGFTDEVKRSHLDLPNVTLVVVEPRADGGWAVTGLSETADEQICKLFDPDTTARKLERVRAEIETRSADLLTGGLSADAMGERLGLPAAIVAQAFRQATLADPELQVSASGGDVLLFRGAAASAMEDGVMSVVDRIRQLFGMAGNEAKKINILTERRAKLAQRRDRLYEDIAKLEQRERDLLEQGRQNKSEIVRRRVASQLAQHRRDMDRLNTTANMLNQQINVISTHIHNLTLIQQGQMAQLPEAEELTQDAVRAEEMLEQLKANVDLVGTLETSVGNVLVSQDELAIMKEFEEADRAEGPKAEKAPPDTAAAEPPAGEPGRERKRERPEAG
jgi:hypothetical protein